MSKIHLIAGKSPATANQTWSFPMRGRVPQSRHARHEPTGPMGESSRYWHAGGLNGVLQTKLKINRPGDRYEQEADRIAEQVMRIPGPTLQRKPT